LTSTYDIVLGERRIVMELREIRKQLWNSVDGDFHRRSLAACGILTVFTAMLCTLLWRFSAREFACVLLAVSGLCWLVPIYRLLRIFRKSAHYTFFRTTLCMPKGNRKAIAFPVMVPGGEQYWTECIFYIRNLKPLLSDYLDKTVTVAWNRETGMVIVIGK